MTNVHRSSFIFLYLFVNLLTNIGFFLGVLGVSQPQKLLTEPFTEPNEGHRSNKQRISTNSENASHRIPLTGSALKASFEALEHGAREISPKANPDLQNRSFNQDNLILKDTQNRPVTAGVIWDPKLYAKENLPEKDDVKTQTIIGKPSGTTCRESCEKGICWPETNTGQMAFVPCPDVTSLNSTGHVSRMCDSSAKWSASVDYMECFPGAEKQFLEILLSDHDLLGEINYTNSSNVNFTDFNNNIMHIELVKCLYLMGNQPKQNKSNSQLYCPRTFDGWSCWNDTLAGTVAYIKCPSFIIGFVPEKMGHRLCKPDGTWFRHPDTNQTWSNYTTCIDVEDLKWRNMINNIYVAGYSMSLIALVFSLVIFCHFRSLRCTRICIHKNLFISFILNNVLWIFWYREVVIKPEEVIFPNQIGCQGLHILVHYFMLTSYFWMFCEGIYLHTLLAVAFVSEDRIMRWLYLLGWGVPAVIISVYGVVRGTASEPDETRHCWINESRFSWFLSVPVCASMVTNLVFLINIVRVLVIKLRANNFNNDVNGTKKAVKATLILIPLLGLHYVLIPFRPEQGAAGEHVYHITSAIVSSLQGFFVALLFCFCNSEVISAVRKKWRQFQFMHETRRYSCSTAYAFSINSLSQGQHGTSPIIRRISFNQKKQKQILTNNKNGVIDTVAIDDKRIHDRIITEVHMNGNNNLGHDRMDEGYEMVVRGEGFDKSSEVLVCCQNSVQDTTQQDTHESPNGGKIFECFHESKELLQDSAM